MVEFDKYERRKKKTSFLKITFFSSLSFLCKSINNVASFHLNQLLNETEKSHGNPFYGGTSDSDKITQVPKETQFRRGFFPNTGNHWLKILHHIFLKSTHTEAFDFDNMLNFNSSS